jgi:hypothetical protein
MSFQSPISKRPFPILATEIGSSLHRMSFFSRLIIAAYDQTNSTLRALEISAITVLPPNQSRPRLTLSSFLSSMASNILYFSMYLVPECDISYIPPPSPSTPFHPSLTHLSIINFRVPPSFLALFPLLVEVTVTLLLTPAQNELVHLQYRPKDVQGLLLSLPPITMKRLTMTCTNLPVEILALTAQRFPNLTHLSFVWIDAPDRISGGVESTDITDCLRQYAEAIAPLSNTLEALYLPACVGVPASKSSSTTLLPDDELLGEGPVLLPSSDSANSLIHGGMGGIGFVGVNQPVRHGRINVGMRALLDACKTLVKGVGSVRTVSGEVVGANGMWALEKIGWLIPQGHEQPLLPIECLRRRGVVKFGASTNSQAVTNLISNGVRMMSISSGDTNGNYPSTKSANSTLDRPSLPPFSLIPTTYTPNSHKAMTVPITYGGGHDLITPTISRPIGYFSTSSFQMIANVSPVLTHNPSTSSSVAPPYKEETEYWYPSMEWSDDCAWPAFAEIEAVFPRPACMRY